MKITQTFSKVINRVRSWIHDSYMVADPIYFIEEEERAIDERKMMFLIKESKLTGWIHSCHTLDQLKTCWDYADNLLNDYRDIMSDESRTLIYALLRKKYNHFIDEIKINTNNK